ncbi:hypothetical protein ACLNGM_02410 [Aureimonas phyllosphaerae]|uniref:hypothetical protein n=1 Tax=Aureimonas phyllosphaerae TaxID=1166078 RepID=UPI003A5BB601
MSDRSGAAFTRRQFLAAAAVVPFVRPANAIPSLLDRVMVQGRPQDTGSPYKVRNIMPALDALGGLRRMRCRAPFSGTPGWQSYEGLANEGVRFCFTLPIKDPTVLVDDMVAFVRLHPGSIFAIEFPNEPDLNPVSYKSMKDVRLGAREGDAPALMAFCRDITQILSQTEELKEIPRVSFNDWMQAEQSDLVAYANSHIYPKPTTPVDAWLPGWRALLAESGHKQGMITEWGRTTGGDASNPVAPPVSLDQQAELLSADLRSILAEPTVATVSLYELLSWPGDSEQNNFGLFNADLSPRPVVDAIRAIVS